MCTEGFESRETQTKRAVLEQPEYFSIPLYGTPVYAGSHEFVRRYRAADAME